MARDQDRVRGVLPMVEMKSSLFGHFLVSLPFLDYGGILADTPDCEAALASAAAALAAKRRVRHIELRQSVAAGEPDRRGMEPCDNIKPRSSSTSVQIKRPFGPV